jgi:hypothetical protein
MKRSVVSVTTAFLLALIAGCEGGLKEGPPPGPVTSQQTPEFRELMEKAQQKKNMMKGQMGKKAEPTPGGN